MFFLDMLHFFKGVIGALPNGVALTGKISEEDLERVDGSRESIIKFMDHVKSTYPKNLAFELQFPESPLRKALNQMYAMCFRLDEFEMMLKSQAAINLRIEADLWSAYEMEQYQEEVAEKLYNLVQQLALLYEEELAKRIIDFERRSQEFYQSLYIITNQMQECRENIAKYNSAIDKGLTSLIVTFHFN